MLTLSCRLHGGAGRRCGVAYSTLVSVLLAVSMSAKCFAPSGPIRLERKLQMGWHAQPAQQIACARLVHLRDVDT